jgi:hypothetical protein
MYRSNVCSIRSLLAAAGVAALSAVPAFGQTAYTEAAEPNGTKATATSVTLSVANSTASLADRLTGTCSSTDTDYWHIKVAPLAQGTIYRNVLTVVAPSTGTFTHTIRGLNQASGVIGSTDTAVMTASVPTTSGRSVSWYGFGRQEELYYSIAYSTTTATAYSVSYNRAAVAPIDITTQTLNSGALTFRLHNVSGSLNTDCWLYDSNLNPLSTDATAGPAGADGALVTTGGGTGTILSSFTRTLPAGTYYLAVAGSNLANNQASAASDTAGNSLPVLDFPDIAVCSVATGAAATFYVDIQDSAASVHTATSANIALGSNWGGNINWVKFIVSEPALPSATLASNPSPIAIGSSGSLAVTVSPATGGSSADITSVTANISSLTSTPPTTITLSSSDGGVTWTGTAPVDMATAQGNKTIPFTVTEGGAVPGTLNTTGTVTVGPSNDQCSGAITLAIGTSSTPVDNQYAGTNDGPAACVSTVGKGVWYKVTPATTGAYQIDTCGSGFNTILSIYTIPDCSDSSGWTLVACNDDHAAGVCTDAMTSAIQNVGLVAGTTYYIRVQSFNNSGTFTTGPVIINSAQTGSAGACCAFATGNCTLVGSAGCPGATASYMGDGTVCSPSPCVAAANCCNNTTGACTLIYGGSCGTGTTQGSGTTCDSSSCPALANCCNNTTGACTLIYGGSCSASATQGSGTTCDSSSCPSIGHCCSNTSGACTLLYGGSCATGTFFGGAGACDSSACPVLGVCCVNGTGACSLTYSGACATGSSFGSALVCDSSACPAIGVCCLNTTGACTALYGGACSSTNTAGAGTTCDTSSCPVTALCCDNATGACSLFYGATCAAGSTTMTGTSCTASSCGLGACCAQDGTCAPAFTGDCAALANPGTFLGLGVACTAGHCFGEHEPNSVNKGSCVNNAVSLHSGDSITGVATGSTFDTTGQANGPASNAYVDMWLVSTAAAPLGIYRHEMSETQGSASMPWSIRANGQAAGAVVSSNIYAQSSVAGSTPTRLMTWYGFGKQEQMILETASGSSTAYVYTLNDTQVSPTVATGAITPGSVTIRVVNTGANTIDSDTWLYDSGFNALTNDATAGPGGADGQLATNDPAGTTTSFTRTLAPGTYYLAVGAGNISNNQPNDPSENISSNVSGGKTVLDYPDGVLCTTMNSTTAYTCHVELTDSTSATVVSPDITWPATTWNGLINFVKFTVGGSSGVCCRGATCNTSVPQASCTSSTLAGAVFAASATCNSGGSATTPCCYPDYNKTGGITVGDIFDFLNDWFAGSKFAVVGGDGNTGILAVQNIFDFLNAWFAGGC